MFVFGDESVQADYDQRRDVPACHYMFLHLWLRLIGAQNRMQLRRIWLIFTKKTYFYCQGEANTFTSKTVKGPGGEYLVDALELLARGHALKSINIGFNVDYDVEKMFQHLFRRRSESRLIRQLENLSGLGELILDRELDQDEMKSHPEAYASFGSVKLCMEAKRPDELSQRSMATEPSQPKSLTEKIKELEEERDRLKRKTLQPNQQWRKDVRRVDAIDDILNKVQAAVAEPLEPAS